MIFLFVPPYPQAPGFRKDFIQDTENKIKHSYQTPHKQCNPKVISKHNFLHPACFESIVHGISGTHSQILQWVHQPKFQIRQCQIFCYKYIKIGRKVDLN